MKNFLSLLGTLVFLVFWSPDVVKAQDDCLIVEAKVSADGNCVFTTWLNPFLSDHAREYINTIRVNNVVFTLNDTTSGTTVRYSKPGGSEEIVDCDTTGAKDLFGSIVFNFFGQSLTCEFQDGQALAKCPDNVRISQGSNCLVFMYLDSLYNAPPDSITLNDTVYYSQGFDPLNPIEIIYLKDTTMGCDTMSDMTVLLNDTLHLEAQMCTYEDGVLPIVVLAFDHTVDQDQVLLSWKVNSDEPTQRLYLQKSYDGVNWVNIYDQEMSQPITGNLTKGSFSDASIDHSKVYYRLFVHGFQGKGSYSNVMPVSLADRKMNAVYYQPQSRSIMIKAGRNYVGNMTLINAQGQNVMSKEVALSKGGFVEVQVEGALPTGIYFVRFEDQLMPATKLFVQ